MQMQRLKNAGISVCRDKNTGIENAGIRKRRDWEMKGLAHFKGTWGTCRTCSGYNIPWFLSYLNSSLLFRQFLLISSTLVQHYLQLYLSALFAHFLDSSTTYIIFNFWQFFAKNSVKKPFFRGVANLVTKVHVQLLAKNSESCKSGY